MATLTRKEKTQMRHRRLRKQVVGTPERPRLSVYFSGKNIYAQVIDDLAGKTLAAACTTEKEFKGGQASKANAANAATAAKVGQLVAERSKGKSISKVVFDRGGNQYHGKVKALADAARAGGLEF
jgi:large subunit ribosomal protein L18